MKVFYLLFGACIISLMNQSCSGNNGPKHDFEQSDSGNNGPKHDFEQLDSCNNLIYEYEEFDITILTYDNLPYVKHASSLPQVEMRDANGIPIHKYEGRLDYHPVAMVQYGLDVLDVYHDSRDSLLLEELQILTDKLLGISMEIDSSIFFPYSFDFALHGIAEETMMAPWFSGMAQGQILSLFCRLYEETSEEHYLVVSEKIYNSFLPLKGNGAFPWVSCIDEDGNLWLEEYPEDIPALTLNGMNFAIYGVYDYYRITRREDVKELLMASLTTIKVNIEKYRDENNLSWYCQKHDIKSEYYHSVHIDQLHDFYLITGDEYFEKMSQQFDNDTPPAE